MSKDDVLSHPSYGMVSFSRVTTSGKSRLFGSTVESHHHTIRLRIHEADLLIDRELHMERPYAKRQIIEVELSAAQFAELLTSMNVGDGVPCTITHRVDAGEIEEPPATPTESANVRTDFAAKMRDIEANLTKRRADILAALPASLNKSTRQRIEVGLERLAGTITESAPFALDQFQRAAERVTTAAKAEIDAVVTHVVHATGIKALREMAARNETPALPEHVDEESIRVLGPTEDKRP